MKRNSIVPSQTLAKPASSKTARFGKLAALATMLATVASAAHAAVDFSGHWLLKTDPNSVPAAAATPAAATTVKTFLAANDYNAPNGSPEYAKQFCTVQGMPWQTTSAEPVDIRQGPLTVSIFYPVISDPRHIYLDGQKGFVLADFDPTSNGHSIGRWNGDVLLVSTAGFGPQGVKVIPGGGLRTEKSKLSERFELVDPDHLRVTSTWTDPTTLRRPHTYVFDYERAKGPVWLNTPACSPIKAMRQKGMFLPPGAPLE